MSGSDLSTINKASLRCLSMLFKVTANLNVVHRHPHALKIKLKNHRIYVDYFLLPNKFL